MAHSEEKTPLLEDAVSAIREAYGTDPIAKFMEGSEVCIDYEPKKLASFRVCCARRGTVMANPVLFVEQFLLTLLFVGFACLSCYTSADGAGEFKKIPGSHGARGGGMTPYQPPVDTGVNSTAGGMEFLSLGTHPMEFLSLGTHRPARTVSSWIQRQEPKMRAFCMIITGLASFLMALYTSMSVGRWWTIRTQGIGGIKAATVDLEWTVCQLVTQDEKVLSAIRRYGRASLKLVFLWRRDGVVNDSTKDKLLENDLLTPDEVEQLKGLTHCLHETIWAWQIGIVTMLYKEGLIKTTSIYQLLLQHCEEGRKAVQCIHTHLAVRIPMQYIHLLGFVVKMHNIILAVIMGVLFGVTLRMKEYLICCQLFGRTLILPFLFNAIMLINSELSDPFDGTSADDFPGANLIKGLEADASGFVKATQNMPEWIMVRANMPRAKAADMA